MNYKKIILIILVTVFFLQTSNTSLIMSNSYEDNFYRSKIANQNIFQQASEIINLNNATLYKITNEHYFYIDKIENNVIEFFKKELLGWQVSHNGKACKVDETYFKKLGINESLKDQGYSQIFIELEEGGEFVFKSNGIFLRNNKEQLVGYWKHKFSIQELEKQLTFKPVEGKPNFVNGKVKRYYNDGKLAYEGEFKDHKYNGEGKYYYKNGGWYEGEFKDHKYNGEGKLYYNDGELKYEGEFKDHKCNGEGKLYYNDGELKYEGEFKDDKCNGKGKRYYNDGKLRYKGEFKDDKYNGKGKLYYNDGKLAYEGEFKDDKYNGEGKYYYKNDACYEGEFKDGEFHGKGKYYYNDDKLRYEGEFKDDKYNGEGKRYYNNGKLRYEGEFRDDKYNGEGKYYYKNGELRYEGEFRDGKYNGKGTLYYKNGKLKYEGEFRDGEFRGNEQKSYLRGVNLRVLVEQMYGTTINFLDFMNNLKEKSEQKIQEKAKIKNIRDRFKEAAKGKDLKLKVVKLKVSHATIEDDKLVVSIHLLRMLANTLINEVDVLISKIIHHEKGKKELISKGITMEQAHKIMMDSDPELKHWVENVLPKREKKYRKNKLLKKLKETGNLNDRNSLIKKILFHRFEKLKLKAEENPEELVLKYVSNDLEKFISLIPVYEHVLTGLEILLDKKSIDWTEFIIYFQEKSKILNSLPRNITTNKSLILAA